MRLAICCRVVEQLTTPMHNLAGPDRTMLYRLALGTGLRASELRSLTPASFDLETDHATVIVAAAYSKRRREDTQPLRSDLADLIRGWLAVRPRGERLFATMPENTARMLRSDLEAARAAWIADAKDNEVERQRREKSDFLCYRNAAGEVADFHSTRHTYISGIVAGGASVKVAPRVGPTFYVTVDGRSLRPCPAARSASALDALPDFDHQQSANAETATLQATGTDDATTYDAEGAATRGAAQSARFGAIRCKTKRQRRNSLGAKRSALRFAR